jgi:hypothetical protein
LSLDGFVTEPDPSPDNDLGTGGEAVMHVTNDVFR